MSLQFKWVRPDKSTVPYPNVWARFQAKDLDGENLINYSIRDIPEDRFEEVIENMINNYVVDEPVCKSRGKQTLIGTY